MARADTLTKLPLDTWAKLMGIQPLHFGGVQLPNVALTCESAWHQFDWQDHDRVSREEVAQAIASTEADLEDHLGFRLAPAWEEDEWQPVPRPWRKDLVNLNSRDLRGFNLPIGVRWKWFISGGIRSSVLLEDAAPIVYSNTRNPTDYKDTATVTVTLAQQLPPCEIGVYYPGHNGDPRWQIKPVEVSVTAGAPITATITFQRHQAIAESFITDLGFDPDDQALRPADGLEDGDFLTNVDVYRVFNDPQRQATLVWEPRGVCGCSSGETCPVCAFSQQQACLLVRDDPRLGYPVIRAADWNGATLSFDPQPLCQGRAPDTVRFFYYAGFRDRSQACPTNEMDPDLQRIVAYMAAGRLPRRPCQCASHFWERWSADLAFSGGATELAEYQMSPGDLDNPLGTLRGEVYAWKRISARRNFAIGRAAFA